MSFVCFNGKFFAAGEPLFHAGNRSFRYGDGVFETMKVYKGRILLENFHFDRLLLGLKMLQIKNCSNSAYLSSLISELCSKNNCTDSARIRLAVFRNEQGNAEFVIEAFHLSSEINQWNEKGLCIEIYPYARKHADAFSNMKSANFLPYILAEIFAKERGMDDAIVLNAFNFICDSSKANVFLIKKKEIFTPALHQGCVAGVRRRFLLNELKSLGYRIRQQEITEHQLLEADEVFLTNSIFDLRWVEKFRERTYSYLESSSIYRQTISRFYE